jgi:hypothetical protein
MRAFGFVCLGIVVGGAVGLFGGFFGGGWIAEMDDPRCFEGSCGLAAITIAPLTGFFGAIFGPLVALGLMSWRDRRRKRKAAASAA